VRDPDLVTNWRTLAAVLVAGAFIFGCGRPSDSLPPADPNNSPPPRESYVAGWLPDGYVLADASEYKGHNAKTSSRWIR